MAEAEARAALAAFVAVVDVEPWIVDRPWRSVPGGWTLAGEFRGWRFRLKAAPGGVRVVASTGGASRPAAWVLRGRPRPTA